jgi:hypothetical protein
MSIRFLFILALALCACPTALFGEDTDSVEGMSCTDSPFIIETSLWMIANFFPDPADFYQLNAGYELDSRNVLFVGATTWKYDYPLGIPYGKDFESAEEEYPGYVRAFGVSLGYQRFLWKGLYASAYLTPFLLTYHLSDGSSNKGFQLYAQAHIGYQFNFFDNRLYLEPAISCNYWPVLTGMPDTFNKTESRWPNWFLCEPHLNIGIRL